MIKKILKRIGLGFIIEVFVTQVITLLISLNIGDGNYYFLTPGLMKICSSELKAVILQFVLAGILGSVMAGSTFIWEIESWSITRQTVCHFFIITIPMLIVSYICEWMRHSIRDFILWLVMFIVVYIIIWSIYYFNYKRKIKQINSLLIDKNQNRNQKEEN